MINHCLENNIQIAICHTQKVISQAKQNQTTEQRLKSNQATYKPHDIFSAGTCELIEVEKDGRMYLNIHMQNRYKSVKEIQTLPFHIHECELYEDRDETEEEFQLATELKRSLLQHLILVTKDNLELQQLLKSEIWQQKPLKEFSLELFSLIGFEADIQQNLLSLNSAVERLDLAVSLILNER